MDRMIEVLNAAGQAFCVHAGRAFVQSSILIGALLALDFLLRKRVRAVVRYAMWMLVFVKLVLPPTLALPTGIGYYRPHRRAVVEEVAKPIPAPSPAMVTPSSTPVVTRTAESVDVPAVVAQSTVALSPTTEPVTVRPAMAWQAWIFLAWCAGVVVLCICLVRRFRYAGRLVHQSAPAPGPMPDVLAQCARTLGLRRCPDLRLSDDAPGPVVCGLLSPVVLMPTELGDDLSADRLRAVLVHELAHIKRADLWINFIQTLLLVAYFYHPLLWLVNAIVRRLREQAVDEMVLVALDADAADYGTTLIDLAEMTFHRPILGLRLIGIAESKKALEGRIRHMVARPKPKSARVGLWALAAIVTAGAILLPMARAQRRSEPGDTAQSATETPSHHIDAPPLTDLERSLVQQVLDMVEEVDERFPEQTMHWPDGPSLYHVDAQGRVTVWSYQKLWRRDKDCRAHEVGWGSSELVNAIGMYYLPDGTPLSSRWSERGGGMKDIRVDVGRVVDSDERVGLIHRHAFPDRRDLRSKDGCERTLVLSSFGGPWVRMIVRVDQPMDLVGWWVGDIEAVGRDFEGYEQMRLSGPPRENRGPMLITLNVPTPNTATMEARLEAMGPAQPLANLQARAVSGTRLMDLGKALMVYADDHDDRFPDRMADAADCYPINLSWLQEHVVYLGQGKILAAPPDFVLAYDKILLEKGAGTLVLFADTHVDFRSRQELEALGVRLPRAGEVDLEARVVSRTRLSDLGKALLIYANDHDDKLPEQLSDLREEVRVGMSWLQENVTYLGQGVSPVRDRPLRVLAYDKTLLRGGHGTNVLYLDSHVAFETLDTLDRLGIRPTAKSATEVQKDAELQARVNVLTKLKKLALAAILYASENNDRFASDLEDLKPYLGPDDDLWVWVSENVEYIGGNTQAMNAPPAFRPLAYCRLSQDTSDELAVAFQDGHVEIVKGPRLKQFGIEIKP